MKFIQGLIFILIILFASAKADCEQTNIFIISVDGFRSDYLNRGITPNINTLAAKGVRTTLNNVFPTTSYPNHVSLFTGCYPENHGIISNEFKNKITGEYFDSRVPVSYNSPKWYNSKFLWEYAEQYGIYSSMIFIPGASVKSEYKSAYYYLDQSSKALPKFRIIDAFDYLKETEPFTPQLTAILFNEVDENAHLSGTNSDKTNESIANIDNYVGIIIDSLKGAGIYDNTDIIFISVHGMTNIIDTQTVNIAEILYNHNVEIDNFGAYAFLYCQTNDIDTIRSIISKNQHLIAYTKKTTPDSLHIKNHPFAPDLLVIPDYKWIITEKNDFNTHNLKAMHGYLPTNKDMKGIFIATGPSFKNNYKIDEINIIDIYPMLCKILGIYIPPYIDGKFENIKEILK